MAETGKLNLGLMIVGIIGPLLILVYILRERRFGEVYRQHKENTWF